MTRPEDIPADVWDIAGRMMIGAYDTTRDLDEHRVRIARALLAYGQSRAEAVEAEVEKLRAGPKVKPLEWRDAPGAMADMQCKGIASVGNNYVLTKLWNGQRGAEWCCLGDMYPTIDAAKAAAQADYEARIMSALVQP